MEWWTESDSVSTCGVILSGGEGEGSPRILKGRTLVVWSRSHGNLPKPIREPDKLGSRALLRIRRQEYLLAETGAERLNASGKVQAFECAEMCGVQNHAPLFVQIDESCIERAMISGR